jgi:hypothetical protein
MTPTEKHLAIIAEAKTILEQSTRPLSSAEIAAQFSFEITASRLAHLLVNFGASKDIACQHQSHTKGARRLWYLAKGQEPAPTLDLLVEPLTIPKDNYSPQYLANKRKERLDHFRRTATKYR